MSGEAGRLIAVGNHGRGGFHFDAVAAADGGAADGLVVRGAGEGERDLVGVASITSTFATITTIVTGFAGSSLGPPVHLPPAELPARRSR